MLDFLIMLIGFALAVVLHIFWCRKYALTQLAMVPFCVIALGVLGGYWTLSWYWHAAPWCEGLPALLRTPLWASSSVVYFLLIPTYLAFYFGTRVESPSKRMMLLIQQQGGLSQAQILSLMPNETLVIPRLDDLVHSRCVVRQGERFYLTSAGINVARMLHVYQVLSGREIGG